MGKRYFWDRVKMKEVVQSGLCTACGTCVGVCPEGCLSFNLVTETPEISEGCIECGMCLDVCPGKDIPFPQLERVTFGRERNEGERYLGVYSSLKIGQACDPEIRIKGASGGLVTALLCHAFASGMIDGAIVSGADPCEPWIARPRIATSADDLRLAMQSKYVLVPVNRILNEITNRNLNRVAIVGLPCHIHGLRKMKLPHGFEDLNARIALIIGLFCGSNYSRQVVEHFIREFFHVELEQVRSFQYRGGLNNQEVILTTKDGKIMRTSLANRIYLTIGHKKERCLVCADLYADLSDISFGDVFTFDDHKTIPNISSIIVRNEKGEDFQIFTKFLHYLLCLKFQWFKVNFV